MTPAPSLMGDCAKAARSTPDAWYQEGMTRARAGRYGEARELVARAFAASPHRGDMAYNLGVLARMDGDLPAAVDAWRQAVRLAPDMPDARFNLARGLAAQGRSAAARDVYRRLLELAPDHTDARYNLGNLLAADEDYTAAADCFEAVLSRDPGYTGAWVNLGLVMKHTMRLDRAEDCYRRAIALDPAHADAHWNLAQVLMLRERWEEGWTAYEWRLKRLGAPRVAGAVPLWDGSPAPGRRLVVWAEQGMGDTIQFLRYVRFAARSVGAVTVACHGPLVRLAAAAPGVDRAVPLGDAFDAVHCHAPLMSLPHLMGMADPVDAWMGPYLAPVDPPKAISGGPGLKVGLVWGGNPEQSNDRNRSIPVGLVAPLAALPGIRCYSFQVGRDEPPPQGVVDLAADLGDFADTARCLQQMDLVITVDTAVAHLAGAMGRRVWLLLSFVRDWRWPFSGTRTPWYPTMRIFRQPGPRSWPLVMSEVTAALERETTAADDRLHQAPRCEI